MAGLQGASHGGTSRIIIIPVHRLLYDIHHNTGISMMQMIEKCTRNIESLFVSLPQSGAYHHSVVTPTGNVYVAWVRLRNILPLKHLWPTCIPLNSMVAMTGCGFQVVAALSSLRTNLARQCIIPRYHGLPVQNNKAVPIPVRWRNPLGHVCTNDQSPAK